MTAPGWYVDPENQDRERYWNGGSWQRDTRPLSGAATAFADPSTAGVQAAPRREDGLQTTGGVLYIVAVLIGLGAVISGGYLLAHTTPSGCFDGICGSQRHPYIAAGVAVLIGGLVQACVVAVVGRLCIVTAGMRRHVPASRVEAGVDH